MHLIAIGGSALYETFFLATSNVWKTAGRFVPNEPNALRQEQKTVLWKQRLFLEEKNSALCC
jgi:hypothetical protein